MSAAAKRLDFFDMLKGLAIFLVVAGHVLSMCIRDIDRTFLLKMVGEIHMPLFFFISGYFTFKISGSDNRVSFPSLGSRFRQLIVPGTVTALLWMVYFPHSGLESPFEMTWEGMWLQPFKCGYWFTFVLFEIIVLYRFTVGVSGRHVRPVVMLTVSTVVWALLSAATFFESVAESEPARLLSLSLVASFYPAFMAGAFARMSGDRFFGFCNRGDVFTVSLTGSAFLIYLLAYRWEFTYLHESIFVIAQPLLHVALAIVAVALVKPWAERAYSATATPIDRRFASLWSYLGRQSLAIYLLHYFFLFPHSPLQEPLRQMSLGFVPSLTVAVTVASLVIAVTLLFNLVISRSYLLSWLLAGRFNVVKS